MQISEVARKRAKKIKVMQEKSLIVQGLHVSRKARDFLEQQLFEQKMYHNSPNKIVGGFKLSKVGTGLGSRKYGYGVYLSADPSIQSVVKFDDEDSDRYVVVLKDGVEQKAKEFAEFLQDEAENVQPQFRGVMQAFADEFYALAAGRQNSYVKEDSINYCVNFSIPSNITSQLKELRALKAKSSQKQGLFSKIKGSFNKNQMTPEEIDSDIEFLEAKKNEFIADARSLLESYAPVAVNPANPKGQLYVAEGPENENLLNWDESLSNQTPFVKDCLMQLANDKGYEVEDNDRDVQQIISEITALGAQKDRESPSRFSNKNQAHMLAEQILMTDFYQKAAEAAAESQDQLERQPYMRRLIGYLPQGRQTTAILQKMYESLSSKKISMSMTGGSLYRKISTMIGGDKRASLLLLKYGIPGLRYWNAYNNAEGEAGSWCFCIWNTKKLEILESKLNIRRMRRI